MEFCMDHWNKLREAIEARGMASLISDGGEAAAKKMLAELSDGEVTIDNFDPLLAAHWAIVGNAMRVLEKTGNNPLYWFSTGPEDIVQGYGILYDGKKWPRCPLCYLGLAHEMSCTDRRCTLPRKNGYDWMIQRAADEALHRWETLRL